MSIQSGAPAAAARNVVPPGRCRTGAGKPSSESDCCAIVTRAGVTRLDRGQGLTGADHDGTAGYDAGWGRYTLIQNHEID